ncbi:hypothetical protein BI343_16865 [Chromobacterium amazonense]|uniref:DUF2798 domain-containing protein n=1 Tax=Chromobacterium amazonense TaxID=1382803 RepID=UPI0008DAFEC2|nr:DUF2798 domain-containing protein [Chromobacterium amazonense]OHX15648.1 hypothetical protein BI343_16865 [Chromobacterium amazonense]
MHPALRQRLLFSLLMSGAMSLVMTAWFTGLNLGLHADFLGHWLHAFAQAWPIALGAVLLLAPPLQKLTARLLNWRAPATGAQSAPNPKG